MPCRRPANQPKPNTRFLNNIIRDTNSHNRALLAKESAESAARLRDLERTEESKRHTEENRQRRLRPGPSDTRKRMLGDIHAIIGGSSRKRKADDGNSDPAEGESARKASRREGSERDSREGRSKRHESRSGGSNSKKELFADHDERHASSRHKRTHKDRSRSRERSHRREHSGPSRSHNDSRHRSHRHRSNRDGSGDDKGHSYSKAKSSRDHESERRHRRHEAVEFPSPNGSDSDPLDDLIGPAPPPQDAPATRPPRGRGAVMGSSGIDRRFAADYDPKNDISLDVDEDDDWGTALEALKDRERWKKQGGDRLRAAGFTEDQIKKWEKGGPTEEDVSWSKKGEQREWDRGKDSKMLADGTLE